MNKYRYCIKSTGGSSDKYGVCSVCGKHVTEVFNLIEERYYNIEKDNKIFEGWTKNQCYDIFGHKECLESKQR
jgi:hypothetical protein